MRRDRRRSCHWHGRHVRNRGLRLRPLDSHSVPGEPAMNQVPPSDPALAARIEVLLAADHAEVRRRTDRFFAGLMSIQWLAGVFAALLISPRAWAGTVS